MDPAPSICHACTAAAARVKCTTCSTTLCLSCADVAGGAAHASHTLIFLGPAAAPLACSLTPPAPDALARTYRLLQAHVSVGTVAPNPPPAPPPHWKALLGGVPPHPVILCISPASVSVQRLDATGTWTTLHAVRTSVPVVRLACSGSTDQRGCVVTFGNHPPVVTLTLAMPSVAEGQAVRMALAAVAGPLVALETLEEVPDAAITGAGSALSATGHASAARQPTMRRLASELSAIAEDGAGGGATSSAGPPSWSILLQSPVAHVADRRNVARLLEEQLRPNSKLAQVPHALCHWSCRRGCVLVLILCHSPFRMREPWRGPKPPTPCRWMTMTSFTRSI